MKSTLKLLIYASCLLLLLEGRSSFASAIGTVLNDSTFVYKYSDPQSEKIARLKAGSTVLVSDPEPRTRQNGLIKIRTKRGRLGWIEEKTISITPIKEPPPMKPHGDITRFSMRVIGGLNWATNFNFNAGKESNYLLMDLIETPADKRSSTFNFAPTMGFQVNYLYQRNLAFVLRAEYLFMQTSYQDEFLTRYSITLWSIPVLGGAEYYLPLSKRFRLFGDLLVGVGVRTGFDFTAATESSVGTTSYFDFPFTAQANVGAQFAMNKRLSVVFNLGYRFLQTKNIQPKIISNGSEALKEGPGNFISIKTSFSGVLSNLGISFQF
jgi:hypothetical protein